MKVLLGKHELASSTCRHESVWHRIYNHTNRISVVNFKVLNRSHNYRVFNVRTIV